MKPWFENLQLTKLFGETKMSTSSNLPPKKNLLQRSTPTPSDHLAGSVNSGSTNTSNNVDPSAEANSNDSKSDSNDVADSTNIFKTFEDSLAEKSDLALEESSTAEIGNFVIPQTDDVNERESPNEASDDTVPRHTPGDLVWARVSGYPWWPSMVTNDPIQSMFFKVAQAGGKKVLYHVQFFGSVPERAWINWKNLVKYENAEQFDKLPSAVNPKSKGKKGSKKDGRSEKNEVPPSKKLWWEDSVKEANEAKSTDKYVRLDRYLKFKQTDQIPEALFSPTIPLERITKKETARKRESSTAVAVEQKESTKVATPSKKIKNDPDFVQEIFDLYKTKHLNRAKERFPDYDDDDLDSFLLLQWKNLDQKIKDKYKKRYENPDQKFDSGDETDPGDEESLINRARPLRKCVLTLGTNAYKGVNIENATKPEESPAKEVEEPSPPKPSPGRNRKNEVPNASSAKTQMSVNSASASTKKPVKSAAISIPPASATVSDSNSLIVIPDLNCRSPIPMLTEAEALEQANAEGHMDEEDEEITGCRAAKKEFVCKSCETSGELLLCEGRCSGAFHLSCLGIEEVPEGEFLCEECKIDKHTCYICRINTGEVRPCSVLYCGKFYHDDCLKAYPLARISYERELICPLHACASCGFHKKNSPDVFRGKMYRCVRCPVAYHCGDADACLAAGCAIIAPNSIICCKHFMPVKNNKNHAHINVSWCFVCSKGGSLLCCERCPASFHLKCIGMHKLPKESWFCNSCTLGLRPRYGDILWAKVQNYRWWPAEVIFPRLIPQKSLEEPHQVGEFIVQLFATKEYHWVHIGLTFLFHENDKNFHEPGEKHYPKNFQLALDKASEVLVKRKSFTRKSALPSLSNQPSPKASDLLKPAVMTESTKKKEAPPKVEPEPETSFLPLLNQPNLSPPGASEAGSPLLSVLQNEEAKPKGRMASPAKREATTAKQKPQRNSVSSANAASPAKKPRGRVSGTAKKQQELVAAAAALMAQVSSASINANASKATAEKTSEDAFNVNGASKLKLAQQADVKVLPRKEKALPSNSLVNSNPKITNITPPVSPCMKPVHAGVLVTSSKMEPLTVQTESSSSFNMPHVPENYKLVYQNVPCNNVQVYSADITEITPCECKVTDPDPCGPTSDCWNRLLCVECHPKVCRSGDRCSNQRFQKAQYPRFEISYTKNRGWGLKTKVWIKKGDFVNEYCGDLIDIDECQRRLTHQNTIGDFNFYFCVLDKERIIDAGPRGNFSRFMNHSCDPNCETQKWTVNGDIRVGLFALTDICPGTELTFNYNMDCLGNSKLKCKCNSPSCSGYIGMKPLKGGSNLEKDRKRKKRDRRERPLDHCYRCGNQGSGPDMISCGRQFCGKIYHKSCLKAPELGTSMSNFECPLHACDICGKVAVYICSQCDHSTCQEHEKGIMYELDDHTFRCKFHYQLLIEKSRPPPPPQAIEGSTTSSFDAIRHSGTTSRSGRITEQTGGQKTLLEIMASSAHLTSNYPFKAPQQMSEANATTAASLHSQIQNIYAQLSSTTTGNELSSRSTNGSNQIDNLRQHNQSTGVGEKEQQFRFLADHSKLHHDNLQSLTATNLQNSRSKHQPYDARDAFNKSPRGSSSHNSAAVFNISPTQLQQSFQTSPENINLARASETSAHRTNDHNSVLYNRGLVSNGSSNIYQQELYRHVNENFVHSSSQLNPKSDR